MTHCTKAGGDFLTFILNKKIGEKKKHFYDYTLLIKSYLYGVFAVLPPPCMVITRKVVSGCDIIRVWS